MTASQQRQIKIIKQKSEILEYKNTLILNLQNVNRCSCQFNPTLPTFTQGGPPALYKFNSGVTTGQTIDLNKFKENCTAGSNEIISKNMKLSSGLEVDKIQLKNFKPSAPASTDWVGDIEISFKQASFAGTQLKNLKISGSHFLINNATPGASFINSCIGVGGGMLTSCLGPVQTFHGNCGNPGGYCSCPNGYLAVGTSGWWQTYTDVYYYCRRILPGC